MRTVAFSKTLAARCLPLVIIQLSMCCVIAGDNGRTATPEMIDRPFIVDFQFGQKATPFVDPEHPPILELTGVTWNLRRLKGYAEYHNLDSSETKKVEGRQIAEKGTDGTLFWPYARLEVSNQWEGEWAAIGWSPVETDGTEDVIVMYPDKAVYVDRSAPKRETCYIDFSPFREFIGKFKYGRVVLRSGGASQTIVLTDLQPFGPSPTPASTSGDSSTPSR